MIKRRAIVKNSSYLVERQRFHWVLLSIINIHCTRHRWINNVLTTWPVHDLSLLLVANDLAAWNSVSIRVQFVICIVFYITKFKFFGVLVTSLSVICRDSGYRLSAAFWNDWSWFLLGCSFIENRPILLSFDITNWWCTGVLWPVSILRLWVSIWVKRRICRRSTVIVASIQTIWNYSIIVFGLVSLIVITSVRTSLPIQS